MCNICKQPFNPQRNVNRHHWYNFYFKKVVFAQYLYAVNVQEKELTMKDHVTFVF